MDYSKIIHAIIDDIVSDPDSVLIRSLESESGKDVTIMIATEPEDTARLIGKHGGIANAVREVMNVAGKTDNVHIHLKFESFGEDNSSEDF